VAAQAEGLLAAGCRSPARVEGRWPSYRETVKVALVPSRHTGSPKRRHAMSGATEADKDGDLAEMEDDGL